MVELEALQNNLSNFQQRGAAMLALCPQRQIFNDETATKLNLGFPVLQDRGNLIATAFGLTLETPPDVIEAERYLGLDLPALNETDHWDLPMPARYIIDRSSVIQYASLHVDHRIRRDPQECLDIMQEGC